MKFITFATSEVKVPRYEIEINTLEELIKYIESKLDDRVVIQKDIDGNWLLEEYDINRE